ncbi:hypothetical protein HZI73_09180 [Vallitalea pronyensis]|uniref:Signal transduction histidine kinase internal region domain-containing protein n=1 Tax=Vallitalea pronyensis TaxID=1348613 RepID=A0A8J8MJL3_9FIRM|nr:histidine kinase [Vallitalea pronyensis]QUI22463.1 hypothetical protein HZI73_09180 [Vallitalea pronyensis]
MEQIVRKILFPSLISVQDFAYIEEAHGTYEMLKLIEVVLRYTLRESDYGILESEMKAMTAILELYRYRFGNFQYTLQYDEAYKLFEIQRFSLLNALMDELQQLVDEVSNYQQLCIRIKFDPKTQSFYINPIKEQ